MTISPLAALMGSLGAGTVSVAMAVVVPKLKPRSQSSGPRKLRLVVRDEETADVTTPLTSEDQAMGDRATSLNLVAPIELTALEDVQPNGDAEVKSLGEPVEHEPRKRGLFSSMFARRVDRKSVAMPEQEPADLDAFDEGCGPVTAASAGHDENPLGHLGKDPSLSLDAQQTIVEHPGETAPSAELFSTSAQTLAEQLQAEKDAEEERERLAVEAREAAAQLESEVQEREAEHQRNLALAEAEGKAKGHAWSAQWFIRLDPDLDGADESSRMKLATSLALAHPWAEKLIRIALEQEESQKVRARLIGALARGGHRGAAVFTAAAERSQVEAIACVEALRPYVKEAVWIEQLIEQHAAQ